VKKTKSPKSANSPRSISDLEIHPELDFKKKSKLHPELNQEQKAALEILNRRENIFLTGPAGSGKSFLMNAYLSSLEKRIPILASTGAAAILVGGRTFHSFFGLGILEGGVTKTVERALKNRRLISRIKKAESVVIDEISMISGPTFSAAEQISRKIRNNSSPWGGLRIIAVGDFAQLPPVNPFTPHKEWAFLDETWESSQFNPILLRESMRSKHPEFLEVLNEIRLGRTSSTVKNFLDTRTQSQASLEFLDDLTCLFPFRDRVESHNLERLAEIKETEHSFETNYSGEEKDIEMFKKHSPLPDVIQIKKRALVMLRQNDPEGRWVNGTTGQIEKISSDFLTIRLHSGKFKDESFDIPKTEFTLLNAEGDPVVVAKNFPVTLAWAMTIHKAQGATLSRMRVDLRKLWEPGQAYVALSRARNPDEVFLDGWSPSAIFADPAVAQFHSAIS
jgi:ATP-dependent DNA helicase PIF1